MKLNILFILSIVLTSCNGQNAAQNNKGNTSNNNSTQTIGDTVPGLTEAIMVIHQDKKNLYWFGSKGHGVYRYDGKFLIQYTIQDGLVSNDIWGIQEDKAGNIYFDTQEGVSKYDGLSFTTLTVSNTSSSEWKMDQGDLWFKGNWNKNGSYRYDGKILHHLEFPKNERADTLYANFPNMTWSPYGLYSLYKDKKGSIWFGTSNMGIYRYDGKSLSWMFVDHLTNIPNGGSFGIRSILEDKNGKFWFCNTRHRYTIVPRDSILNGNHLIRYQEEKGLEHLKTTDGKDEIYYMSITEDNKNNMWMVTYADGVYRYDGKNTMRFAVKDGIKDVKLFSIYKDNVGDLWLGTHDAGAYKFNGKYFEKFKP